MRDPAIHIRLTDLVTVLEGLGVETPIRLAKNILTRAVPFTIRDRYIVQGDAKTRTKATKVIAAAAQTGITTGQFNLILTAQRKELNHKHISPIRKGSRDFTLLEEVKTMACEFCTNCEFESFDEGCKVYIHLGLEKMKYGNTYGLSKFKYYDAEIYKAYESLDMIENDPDPKRTKQFLGCYIALLAEYAGIDRDDLNSPENYVCFVYTRLEADRVQADTEDWLRAQFEELQRMVDAVPTPNQLFNENALKRYYNYFRSTNKADKDADKVTLDWGAPKTEFERKYAEKMREKYSEK